MSILTQNSINEVALIDCIQRFFSKHHVGELLKKCNGTKEKGVPAISLLAADIVNNDIKELTDESRKNVFIIDDSLFNRTSYKKTELGSKVFDHTSMNYKKGYRMLTLS